MKYLSFAFLLIFTLALTSCEDDEDPQPQPTGLLGTWELVEMYADPGDGSGSFRPVESDRIITFETDSTYISNGIICEFSTEINQSTVVSEGTYDFPDGKLTPGDCRDAPELRFRILLELRGRDLILNYPCFEACQAKYRRR